MMTTTIALAQQKALAAAPATSGPSITLASAEADRDSSQMPALEAAAGAGAGPTDSKTHADTLRGALDEVGKLRGDVAGMEAILSAVKGALHLFTARGRVCVRTFGAELRA